MLVLFSALMEVKGLNTKTISSLKDKFTQTWQLSHYLLSPMQIESQVKFVTS